MAAITVRNVPEKVHRALKMRAARNGRSTEAEVRLILQETVAPKTKIKVGSELAALGRRFGGIDLKIVRDKTPAEPAKFK
jgi:antitoxin FitA